MSVGTQKEVRAKDLASTLAEKVERLSDLVLEFLAVTLTHLHDFILLY